MGINSHLASLHHGQVQAGAGDGEVHVGAGVLHDRLIGQHPEDLAFALPPLVLLRLQAGLLADPVDALLGDLRARLEVEHLHRGVDLQAAHILPGDRRWKITRHEDYFYKN